MTTTETICITISGGIVGFWVGLLVFRSQVRREIKAKVIHTSEEPNKSGKIKDNKVVFSAPIIPEDEFNKADDIGDFINRLNS